MSELPSLSLTHSLIDYRCDKRASDERTISLSDGERAKTYSHLFIDSLSDEQWCSVIVNSECHISLFRAVGATRLCLGYAEA